MNEFQLDMKLNKNSNQFKDALDNGNFVFLAESAPPENEQNINSAVERMMPLAETMLKQEDLCGGLAVTDHYGSPWSAAEIAAAMPENIRNANCYCLSGNNRSAEQIIQQLNIAANAGAMNILCLSGFPADLTPRICRSREFCGSTKQLDIISSREEKFFAGTQFNPFYYNENTILAAYNSLVKKIDSGAQFIVTQSGWDMLQNQALAWFLFNRKTYLPMIAHLTLLTPDKAEKIIAGKIPGVSITPAFAKLLARELSGSKAQFEAAQYRRIELQSAGCRLMGYSGVQISGVDFPGRAQVVASRIRSAIREFRTFEHWLDEYNSHQAGAEINSGLGCYHLFDRVLRRQYPLDDPPSSTRFSESDYPWKEKLAYKLKRIFFANADKQRPNRDFLLKKLFVNCRGCDKCTLPQNDFVCTKNCPMSLENGPCNAVKDDGKCSITQSECIFVKKVRCSRWLESISCLE